MTFLHALLGFGITVVGLGGVGLGWVLHRELMWRGPERPQERLRVTATQVHQVPPIREPAAVLNGRVWPRAEVRELQEDHRDR